MPPLAPAAVVAAPRTPSLRHVLQLRSSAGLYGADRMVLALDRGLARRGLHGSVHSIRNYRLAAQPLHDAAVARGHDATLLPCSGRADPRTVVALRREILRRGTGVVHVHDYKSATYAWLASRGCDVRLVATLHGWVEASRALRVYNALEVALLGRFDALVVVSRAQRGRLLRAGAEPARIHAIDNGIELADPQAETDAVPTRDAWANHAGGGRLFAAIGRLSPEKNLRQLLDAFAAVAAADAGAHLLVVGDGPERGMLQAHASSTGLEGRVVFTGIRDDVAALYRHLDVLVLPSLSEGMPLVVLEAMAHGVPVIANAVGDVPRLLAHGTHARVLAPGDGDALRAALLEALALPRRRDAAGAAHVREHHSGDAMARDYHALYQALDGRDTP